MDRPTRFGSLLRNARESSSYKSRSSLAKDCGLSAEILRRYELGRALPSNQSLIQILKVLDIDADSREGKVFITAVYEARESRPASEKRSYGASANQELSKYVGEEDISEEKVERLIALFVEYVNPDRTSDSFRHFLRQKILKILE
tara:strand:+ start:75 stop:512 length:438 start_codon:yes stop_codon:yes gene_type:complete